MLRRWYLGLALLVMLATAQAAAPAPEQAALHQALSGYGELTFVLQDLRRGKTVVYNPARAERRFVPASTFKFVNSLLALSHGVVPSTDRVFWRYRGQDVFLDAWRQDMDLAQAFRTSNVLAYQELARAIGPQRMQAGLAALDYGNRKMGPDIASFWLGEGTLAISAHEQVAFLSRLARGKLPLPPAAQQAVCQIALQAQGQGWRLYGKTGWSGRKLPSVGWYVGWLERGDEVYPFALNMAVPGGAFAALPQREQAARDALRALGLLG